MSEIKPITNNQEGTGRPTREEAFSQMRFEQHRQNITHAVRASGSGKICPWCNGNYEKHIAETKG